MSENVIIGEIAKSVAIGLMHVSPHQRNKCLIKIAGKDKILYKAIVEYLKALKDAAGPKKGKRRKRRPRG